MFKLCDTNGIAVNETRKMPSDQNRQLFEIRKFPEFLEKCLGREILDYQLKPLTKPGDNFGSVMQSVTVKVAGKTKSDEVSFKSCFVFLLWIEL